MIPRKATVLVALSGGPDSCALAHALCALRKRLRCQVVAAHVHHGLRGQDADADAAHAAAVAASLGVPFTQRSANVRRFAGENKLSLETAAREVRYHLLAEAARELGADLIATGHTADDQAETVLMNLLRGTGVDGLAGIPPVRSDIIRPLLDVTRAEVEAYCLENKLAYRLDSSNLDVAFTRNRVRHQVLPVLKDIQPNTVGVLCRAAEIVRGENEMLEGIVDGLLTRISIPEADGLSIGLQALTALPVGFRRRLLRAAIGRVKGDLLEVEWERIDALVELARHGRTGAVVELTGGVRVERSYDSLRVYRDTPTAAIPGHEWLLHVPGRVDLPWFNVSLQARRSRSSRVVNDPSIAILDADTLQAPLVIRTWRPGDRFVPLGMSRSKKLQDFFADERVPARKRKMAALVLSGAEIVWVVGHRISDRHKVTDSTCRTVRITASPIMATGEES